MTHQRRTSRAWLTAVRTVLAMSVALLAILLLSACGGSSKPTATTTANAASAGPGPSSTAKSTTRTPGASRIAALRACLQKNGVTSTGPPLPKGVTRAQYRALLKKCGGDTFAGTPTPANNPAFKAALSKFAICLRQNGINLPEPNNSGKGPIFDTKGLNTASTQFRAADAKCAKDLRVAFRGGAASGTRSTSRPETQADLNQKYSNFTTCMSKYGVHVPAPHGSGAPSVFAGPEANTAKFRSAETKCVSTLPPITSPQAATTPKAGNLPSTGAPSGQSTAAEQEAARERLRAKVKRAKLPAAVSQGFHNFSVCMRANGISNYPEPEGEGFNTSKLHINENAAQFKAASKKCEPILNAAIDPQSTNSTSGG